MSSFGLGLLAATAAPSLMVLGFMIWEKHWSGSAFALNMFKCNLVGVAFFIATQCLPQQQWDPSIFTAKRVGFLMLSSTFGILIGDWTWLEGLRILGARKVIVMDCLKPFLAAIAGKIFFGEDLAFPAYVGLGLTFGGVTIVGLEKEKIHEEQVLEDGVENSTIVTTEEDSLLPKSVMSQNRNGDNSFRKMNSYAEQRKSEKQSTQTLVYGFINATANVFLHTIGATLTKMYGAGMTTWQINMIRFWFAGICMLFVSLGCTIFKELGCQKLKQNSRQSSARRILWYSLPVMKWSSWAHICMGVVFVSFFFPALINYAMFQISLALLLTLESIGPLYSLPLSWILQKEQPTFKAIAGAVMAVGGIVILSFEGMTIR